MIKKILVLYSRDVYPDGEKLYEHHVDALNKTALTIERPVKFYQAILAELLFIYTDKMRIIEPRSGLELHTFELVFFQKWKFEPQTAFAVSVYLDEHSVPYTSRELRMQNPSDKLAEMALLVKNSLPYPRTLAIARGMISSHAESLLDTYGLRFPLITKPVNGTRGENIELLADIKALRDFAKDSDGSIDRILIQEYIENEYDYRVTVMGGEIAYVLKRVAKDGSHVNNTSAGASAEFIDEKAFGEAAIQDGLRAATAVGRADFAGTDVLVAKDGSHVILEVNRSPEIQTGYGIERKKIALVEYLYRSLDASP